MTDAEQQIALALGRCTFIPGCWDKSFCHAMATRAARADHADLSERQRDNLLRMAHKYRRQLSAEVIELARGLAVPARDWRRATVQRVLEGAGV